ncbi:1,4-dihydroxy-2-naphthoate polyprenyltransferase [Virgibacillus soli]|uniref:1,4-dihydroxy-2-naphthoate polyprenyltransferase n=1 Tax=Paracerasibacillus soli TaxID=480284 RepID=UPI0035EAD112
MPKEKHIRHALKERDGFHVWWRLLRPHTLTASFIPVFIGSMLAFHEGTIHIVLFLAMLLASMLIQSATNMFNEYYDYVRGLDHEGSVGIGGTIVRDGIKPKTIRNIGILFFIIAMILGVYICIESSWMIALIGSICMLIGYLYTGGPLPIAYTPFGELFAGLLMGTVIICISYYIQTMTLSSDVILISIPFAIFIGAILMSNSIRDLDNDKENGRKTLAILLGRKNAIRFQGSIFAIAYTLTILYTVLKILPWWSLLTLLSIPLAISVIKKFQGKSTPLEMMPAMAATGKTNTIFGLLLGISLIIDKIVS